ncbi:MAG: alpha/beta hydrolase [Ferruginibacter sp.]
MHKIILSFILFILSANAFSQQISGNWEGILQVPGNEIPVVFHIKKDSTGKYSATFDSPKQKAYNLACGDVILKEDSVILMMPVVKGKYAGLLNDDKKKLTGTWYQGPASMSLVIKKTSDVVTIKEYKRPQTPKPPFPYKSEDVEYDNADRSIHFGATFTVPLPDPNVNYFRAPVYPTVLLITGSGKQDRDETIFDHKSFAIIADYLTRQGIAVLRVDDRDMGKTTGNFATATSADFAKDVEAGLDYLKSREDVDVNNIGLLGHSEGGMIAPMVAARRSDVKFIVLLAGPGVKISELMEQQSVEMGLATGSTVKYMEKYRLLYRELVNSIINEPDTAKAFSKAIDIFNGWQKDKNIILVMKTTGVTDEKSKTKFIRAFVKQLSTPWFNYFLKFDPAEYLAKLHCPVLALNGEKDIQVSAKQNLEGIRSALEKSNNKNFKTMEIPGLNHLFQHCKKCSVDEYSELEESFDPGTLPIIVNWIKTERFK